MKRIVSLLVVISFLFCMVSPLFAESKPPEIAAKIKTDISEQNIKAALGADTFWTGVIIGGVSAAILIPVYNLFEDKQGKEVRIVTIVAAGMAIPTLICMIWGGIEWAVAAGRLDELKKTEKDVTLVPYLDPLAQSSGEMGLGVNIKL